MKHSHHYIHTGPGVGGCSAAANDSTGGDGDGGVADREGRRTRMSLLFTLIASSKRHNKISASWTSEYAGCREEDNHSLGSSRSTRARLNTSILGPGGQTGAQQRSKTKDDGHTLVVEIA